MSLHLAFKNIHNHYPIYKLIKNNKLLLKTKIIIWIILKLTFANYPRGLILLYVNMNDSLVSLKMTWCKDMVA
jgi:hypothetical protein